MKILKKFLSVIVLSLFIISAMPGSVQADLNDFVITDFSANYYLTNDDPQGSLRIVEQIDLVFTDNNHGILRAIPASYKGKSLNLIVNKISSESGAPTEYATYNDSGNTVLKIGDPNRTVTGRQQYTIEYTVQNVITFYDDHDELYWDINGDEWGQPFLQVTATFHLANGLAATAQKCFVGSYGSVSEECLVENKNNQLISKTLSPLSKHQTLTVVMAFPKGSFMPPTAADWWRDNLLKVLAVAMPPLLIGSWAFKRWHKHGKDLKGRGVVIPEYEPPHNLKPLEVGVVADYRADNRDISATLIDLAIRGYIKIIEEKKAKLIGPDKLSYSFELLNANTDGLVDFEAEVLKGIFPDLKKGQIVTLNSLKDKFYTTTKHVRDKVFSSLSAQGYFPSDPRKAGLGMWAIAGLLVFAGFVLRTWLTAGLIVSAIIVAIFAQLMAKRTAKGVEAKDAIEGLKLYLNTAEKDRLKMLQSPNAPYAKDFHEPKKTAELFEKLLPFAIALGVEKAWAKQFESIYTAAPDWYSGNWATFNAVYLASSLNSSVAAMGTSFSPPRSSGSSGFGGGGFSGGGGGGGGGGGW